MPRKDKARDASFVAFVVEQLAGLGGVRSKSMFGGYGVYARDVFFACVDDGRLYFRVDDATRPKFEERGMGPFAPMPNMVMKTYYEVPVEVIEDSPELVRWAREAMAAAPARATKRAKPARKKADGAKVAAKPARTAAAAPRKTARAGASRKQAAVTTKTSAGATKKATGRLAAIHPARKKK